MKCFLCKQEAYHTYLKNYPLCPAHGATFTEYEALQHKLAAYKKLLKPLFEEVKNE